MDDPVERLREMDPTAMRDFLDLAREQAAIERTQEAEHAARAQSWENSIQGVEQLMRMHGLQVAADAGEMSQNDALMEMLRAERPSIGQAVLAVMQTKPIGWTAREVYEALAERDWAPDVAHPLRGVEAAINRLWKGGKVEKLGRGRYRAKP